MRRRVATRSAVRRARRAAALLTVAGALTLGGCASAPSDGGGRVEDPPLPPAEDVLPPAPWSAAPLRAASVPSVYLEQWSRAENRATCAPIAFATVDRRDAVARAATFSGGWAVAYDVPDLRSAFGVAGTGVEPGGDTYDGWPNRIVWADGSHAGYGPEGGSGPNQLAYLVIEGQGCLYNVWSRLGVAHLERLLAELRYVDPD